MKRVLVTGAGGFVGANLTRRLAADGHTVHAWVTNRGRAWRLADLADVTLHEVDVRDQERVAAVVAAVRPEWVFHLAVHGAYSWQRDARSILETNVLGTTHLIEACLRTDVEAFVNTGSSSEYGWQGHAPAEADPIEPNSTYAVSKASATLFCRCTARTTRRRMPTLRLYSVYGPYEDPGRLMPALLMHGRAGRYPPLTSPETARDFVYIDDAVDAYLLAAQGPLDDPGAVYNVGTGTQTTLRQLIDLFRTMFRLREEPCWGSMADRSWDTSVWVANAEKIRRDLGWRPRIGLEEGMRRLLAWFEAEPMLRERYLAALAPRAA